MTLVPLLIEAVNARKNPVLCLAEAALPPSQFNAFRKCFLKEFGNCGLERDMARIVAEHDKRQGKE